MVMIDRIVTYRDRTLVTVGGIRMTSGIDRHGVAAGNTPGLPEVRIERQPVLGRENVVSNAYPRISQLVLEEIDESESP